MILITGALLVVIGAASIVVAVTGPADVVLAAIIAGVVLLPVGAVHVYLGWPDRRRRPPGQRAKATVLEVRRTGGDHMGRPVVEIKLEVCPKRDATFEVTTNAILPAWGRRVEPGRTLSVYVDRVDRRRVEIDWASR